MFPDPDPADPSGTSSDGGGTTPTAGDAGGTDAGTSGGKTFTQEEVNALIARETSKASRGKLDPKELGFDSKAELETAIQQFKDAQAEAQTEQERAVEEAKKQAAEEARKAVLSVANERLVRAAFIEASVGRGLSVPASDALVIVRTLPDLWKGVEVTESGEVLGMDDAFWKEFKESKGYLFGSTNGTPGDAGAGAGGGTRSAADRELEVRSRYPALGPAPK